MQTTSQDTMTIDNHDRTVCFNTAISFDCSYLSLFLWSNSVTSEFAFIVLAKITIHVLTSSFAEQLLAIQCKCDPYY